MKIRFHKERPVDGNRRTPLSLHPSPRSGIALVITLIMLAVTLVMAVAFLAISTRERGSVTSSTDANHARLATEAALAHAEVQVIASMLSTTNPYNFGLFVSTNFINRYGFVPGLANPTNVNYDYLNTGGKLAPGDIQQNIANLEYLPRAPVFVPTNSLGRNDFRFYLDLNRNRQFDDTGSVTNYMFINGTFTTNGYISEVGDPQWIGVLEHPDQPHGPLNPFIARYAFIAVPVGNTLDVNAIHNDATMPDFTAALNMKPGEDGFLRNQGVGSWEINLAAFLADLNTNEWDSPFKDGVYNYRAPYGLLPNGTVRFPNTGAAFDDALSILRYRYDYSFGNQASIYNLYFNFPHLVVTGNQVPTTHFKSVDNYSVGPLTTNNTLNSAFANINRPWAGSDNTNHFFGLGDFFNPGIFRPVAYNIAPGVQVFTDRLLQAGTNTFGGANPALVPTYDRYTFYRMLAQLGSDSEPQVGKVNINYKNVDNLGDVLPAQANQAATLAPWPDAQSFFTVAADIMLRNYTTNWINANHFAYTNTFGASTTNAFGITKIPVMVNGQFTYTPAVHRLLQLAANIYDATTNSVDPVTKAIYPSVFQPIFTNYNGNIYIVGYTNVPYVSGPNDVRLSSPIDITVLTNNPAILKANQDNHINVYGIPWIVGAKKGLPNFNEMNVLNTVQVTRLLQFTRTSTNTIKPSDYTTNQMYVMSISNSVGVSLWNSYNSNYLGGGNIQVYVQNTMRVALSNAFNYGISTYVHRYAASLGYWPGSGWTFASASAPAPVPGSFIFTNFTVPFLYPSAYQWQSGSFINISNNPAWEINITDNRPFPQFQFMTTNWLQAYILDGTSKIKHVIDYVQLSGPNRSRNLTTELADPNYGGPPQFAYMWSTNGYGLRNPQPVPTYGEVNQILVSEGQLNAPPGGVWSQAPVGPGFTTVGAQQAFFAGFWKPNFIYNGKTYANVELRVQAPYTPTRTMYDYTLWQANDPLVHYLASDLNYVAPGTTGLLRTDGKIPTLPGIQLNQLGNRYQPWGLAGQMAGVAGVDTNVYNLAYKDPLALGSDSWNFPTNLFPNIGWLGRVHRGTPWQTVFLKATDVLDQTNQFVRNGLATWQTWTGNTGNPFDATNTAPVYDRWLFDLFTAAPNQNATLGQLSVNQTQLAAWSAVFSGIPVFTNLTGTNAIFDHAGVNGTNSPLGYIWNSIQQTRANTNLFRKQVFAHLGDVLASPALTEQSPYLVPLLNDANQKKSHGKINDEMYEWLPQETMGLLKLGAPRYVVYCYGQALKQAQNGTVAGGTYSGMITNYTVVSESAIRAVVEIQGATGNTPHVVLKNVNPLPPD